MNIALRSVEELLTARPIVGPSKEVLSDLKDRIFDAAQVLKRQPDRERVWLTSGDRCAWPTIRLSCWEAYGQHRAKLRLPPPSPKQVTDMEQVMSWITWLGRLDKETMKCVWVCCGQNYAPSQAASILGLHRNTV